MMHKTRDRLDQSRYGLLVVAAATLIPIGILLVFTFGVPRDSTQKTHILIETLSLTTPALFPSGRVLRDAGYANPAVDLRHGPHLPLLVFSPEDLLYGRVEPDQRGVP
jgi:hypothetical protein